MDLKEGVRFLIVDQGPFRQIVVAMKMSIPIAPGKEYKVKLEWTLSVYRDFTDAAPEIPITVHSNVLTVIYRG